MSEIEEQKKVFSFTSTETSPSEFSLNCNQSFQTLLPWNQESTLFGCNLCMKTFYNKNALLNHKNMTHDVTDYNNEEALPNSSAKFEKDGIDVRSFKFIPLEPEEPDHLDLGNDFVYRNFTRDTSYLIVKVEDTRNDAESVDSASKSRLENIIRRSRQNARKSSVDLRGPFTCNLPSTLCPDLQCRQIFFSCCEYSLHYREEHTKRRKAALRCQVCEKRLDQVSYPNTRLTAQFNPANSILIPCHICGMTFLDESTFEEHSRLMHTKIKPHQCTICYKRFAQQGGLQQHLRMHSGIRPFACTFCPKAFTQKAGLDQHLRIHTKVKPFKCVICSKCFSQSVHLRQHMRTHTNIQPFECSVCSKRFKQRSHLNFHLRSHMNSVETAAADRFDDVFQHQNEINFFNLANLQPVQDGEETLYYSAELASSQPINSLQNLHV